MQIELRPFKTSDMFKQQMLTPKNKRKKPPLQHAKKQNQHNCLSVY